MASAFVVIMVVALFKGNVVDSAAPQPVVIHIKPISEKSSLNMAEGRSYPETMMDTMDIDSGVPYWTPSDTDLSSPPSPDYGLNSYYGEGEVIENPFPITNNMDLYYHPGPPLSPQPPHHHYFYKKRRPAPKNLFRLFQSTVSSKASRKFKSFQSALKALGVTAAPPPPTTTLPPDLNPTSETLLTSTTPKPPPNPAVQLFVQLAPTLSKLVDSVGNAVGGEGSLLALKRESVMARLKYKKALFINLPESLILAKLNLPNTLVKGKKALLGVVSSLTSPPMDNMSPLPSTPPTIESATSTGPPTPDSTTSEMSWLSQKESPVTNYGNGQRLADKVSITYQDLEPMGSQIRFHAPSAFFSLQRPHKSTSHQYYPNRFYHPLNQRRRRLMYTFK